jgi:hypothetical protein
MKQPRFTGHNGEVILAGNGCKEVFLGLPGETAARDHGFWRIVFFLVLLPLLFAGCYHSSDSTEKNYKYTPEDKEEAKIIAICLSGAVTPPENLSSRVLRDLAEIRANFGAEFAQATYGYDENLWLSQPIRFVAPWVPSCIIIGFEPGTSQLVAKGQYHDWDDLNELYRASYIDMRMIKYNYAILSFKGQFHSRRLSELYAKLPGLRYAHPNYRMDAFSTIYPSNRAGSGLTYLFRHGWGDCPSGCIYGEYWYFISNESGETIFAGYWSPQKDPKVPDWWSDAKWNIEQYRTF